MARGNKSNGKAPHDAADRNDPETHADAEGSGLGHNSADRADYQNRQFAEWYDLEREIKSKTDEYVKPLRSSLTKLRRNMKADLDMHQEDLKVAYLVYKRRREATEWDDQGEADKVHDSLRELFKNLRAGGQLDFLQAIDEVGDAEDTDLRPNFLREKTEQHEEAEADA